MRTTLHLCWILMLTALFPAPPLGQPRAAAGVIVEEIATDSAAAKAGLKLGDRIVNYDSRQLSSPAGLEAAQENTFGKNEVALEVQRGGETLKLTIPLGALGIQVRPELSPNVDSVYEQGRTALKAKALGETIAKWEAAAKLAQQEGDRAAVAWLYGRIGEIQEKASTLEGS